MIEKISEKVWKFTGSDKANIYFLEEKNIIIDAGNRQDKQLIEQLLSKVVDFNKVKIVIFTHLHYDHIGNFDLFPNAEFFASEEEINEFKNNKRDTILNEDIVEKFDIELKPIPDKIDGLEIIKTPGHTKGCICIWYPEESILFTGDTLFRNKLLGRTDLPTSIPEKQNESIMKLLDYKYKILAPSHDY